MFRRRNPIPFWQRLRRWLWPHIGWRRASTYVVKRLVRLPGTPHSIAAGFACGAAISFTPLVGTHLIIATLLALVVRGNTLAAWAGTLVGNPLTFPFMWLLSYEVGLFLLGSDASMRPAGATWTMAWVWENYGRLALPMSIGAVPVGLACGVLMYIPLTRAIDAYQEARRRRQRRRQRRISIKSYRSVGGATPAVGTDDAGASRL